MVNAGGAGKRQSMPVAREDQVPRVSVEIRMSEDLVADVDALVAKVGATRSAFFAIAAAKLVAEMLPMAPKAAQKRYEALADAIAKD